MLWYAAYDVHVNMTRFLELIRGGASRFNATSYPGCRNRQDPVRDYALAIPRELYFARNATEWGGAVAFVRPEASKSQTLARAYLITDEQFIDLACQLNGRRPADREMVFDYDFASSHAESYFNRADPSAAAGQAGQWYGRIVNLGTRESWPVFTLTAEWSGYGALNAPGRTYVRCVADGIGQLGKISAGALVEYFMTKKGISERISRPVLERWLA
ncbi:MAG: hypothetical protein EA382_06045 [Spirochaetaceae bacterium]|nr:MAG: hypothetical protein EA382_06045 [Spirochaetaceae bacterium]